MKTLDPAVTHLLKRLHCPLEVYLTSVRSCVPFPLSCVSLRYAWAGPRENRTLGNTTTMR